jgi:hypothetical protein
MRSEVTEEDVVRTHGRSKGDATLRRLGDNDATTYINEMI